MRRRKKYYCRSTEIIPKKGDDFEITVGGLKGIL